MTEVNAASLRASPACTFAATFLVGEVDEELKNTFNTLFLTLPNIVEAAAVATVAAVAAIAVAAAVAIFLISRCGSIETELSWLRQGYSRSR